VNEIILNSVDLNIIKIEFQENNINSFLNGSVELNKEYEQARIKFNRALNVFIHLSNV
jgi:hypothetical protein